MKSSVKWAVAGGLFVVVLLTLWVVALRAFSQDVDSEVVADLVVAEPRAEADDSFERLTAGATPIGEAVGDDVCGTSQHTDVDYRSPACRTAAMEHAEALDSLVQTIASVSSEQVSPGQSRMPWPEGFASEPPEMLHHIRAARLLCVASVQAFARGEATTAVRALGAVFSLGGWFIDGAPSLLPLMVGFAIQSMGTRVIYDYLDASTLATVDAEVRAVLPDDQHIREGLRLAIGGEWRTFIWFLEHELESNSGPFAAVTLGVDDPQPESSAIDWGTARATGLYDPAHTRMLMTHHFAVLQQWAGSEKLGEASSPPAPATWEEMGWVKWVHNPIGRLLSGIGMPNFGRHIGRAGQKIDRVRAMRAVLAIRRFYRDQGRWPTAAAELVPTHLEAWPQSVLDGAPLGWEGEGIRLLDESGQKPCTENTCLVPFAAPKPVSADVSDVEAPRVNPHR